MDKSKGHEKKAGGGQQRSTIRPGSFERAMAIFRELGIPRCPICGRDFDDNLFRPVHDSCGHFKCRHCLLQDEKACPRCFSTHPTGG